MTELFLIAHKVRGEPAFDIAEHMECPKCEGKGRIAEDIWNESSTGDAWCDACDGAGHWWIIPTSGHRAFPLMWWRLADLEHGVIESSILTEAGPLEQHPEWASTRDHYLGEREAAIDLVSVLGLINKPLAPVNIKRRL